MADPGFSITINTADVRQLLGDLTENQLPWAMLRTVNDLAFESRKVAYSAMGRAYKNPTPWTMKSLEVIKGRDKMNPSSWMGLRLDAPQQRALSHHFSGGKRAFKRMEGAFLRKGLIPPGTIMVPGDGCPLDAYSNPKASFIVQLISYFSAFGEQGYRMNKTDKTRKAYERKLAQQYGGQSVGFFISWGGLSGNRLPAGVWMRVTYSYGSAVKPIFMFVRQGQYKKILSLDDIARDTMNQYGMRLLDEHLQAAIEGRQTFPDLS
jgi:hypothetical protein